MKVEVLQGLLSPYSKVSNRAAMAAHYKCLELQPGLIRGCAAFGILETTCTLDIDQGCYVDTHTFMSVVSSLPEREDINMMVEAGVLLWMAGSAKGKMATVVLPADAPMPVIDVGEFKASYTIHAPFIHALRSGTISGTDQSLQTIGMYGVLLENRDFPVIATSDNSTLAWARFGEDVLPGFPDVSYLPPDAVELLKNIVIDGGLLHLVNVDTFLYDNKDRRFLFHTVPPIKHNLRDVVEKFVDKDSLVATIPPDRIKAFIKRASALAESRKSTFVDIGATDGHLSISFTEGTAQSDEYYMVENQRLPEMQPVTVDATKLARALEVTDELVMDYMDQRVLVFRSKDTGFMYILAGLKK
jgi:hypothetical protein